MAAKKETEAQAKERVLKKRAWEEKQRDDALKMKKIKDSLKKKQQHSFSSLTPADPKKPKYSSMASTPKKAAPKPYVPNWDVPPGTPWKKDSPYNPKNQKPKPPKPRGIIAPTTTTTTTTVPGRLMDINPKKKKKK